MFDVIKLLKVTKIISINMIYFPVILRGIGETSTNGSRRRLFTGEQLLFFSGSINKYL